MSYFKDAESRNPMELAPGARARTFWGERMLLSLVEVDAYSEVPKPLSKQGLCWKVRWRWG